MAFASAHPKCSMSQKSSAAASMVDYVPDVQKSQDCFAFRSEAAHISYWQKIRKFAAIA
jgi:hypothetical protein